MSMQGFREGRERPDFLEDLSALPFPPKWPRGEALPDAPSFDFLNIDVEQHPVERTIQSSPLSYGELISADQTGLLRALGTKSIQQLIQGQ